jgi:hypothetical protein
MIEGILTDKKMKVILKVTPLTQAVASYERNS